MHTDQQSKQPVSRRMAGTALLAVSLVSFFPASAQTNLSPVASWKDTEVVTRPTQLDNPTHIDSHQHFHMEEPAHAIVVERARKREVPLRGCTSRIAHCGDFYGQTDTGESLPSVLTVDNLLQVVQSLPAQFSEVACHPALNGDDLQSMYKHEHLLEYDVVTEPNLKSQLADLRVELVSFNHFQLRAGGLA